MKITEARFIKALKTVRGKRYMEDQSVSLVLECDMACIDAFLNQTNGPDVDILREAAKHLHAKGVFPWHREAA